MPVFEVKKSASVPLEKRRTPFRYTDTTPLFTENAMCVQVFAGMRCPALPSKKASLPLQSMVFPSQLSGRKLSHRVENGSPAPSICSSTAPKKPVVNRVKTRGRIQNETVYS